MRCFGRPTVTPLATTLGARCMVRRCLAFQFVCTLVVYLNWCDHSGSFLASQSQSEETATEDLSQASWKEDFGQKDKEISAQGAVVSFEPSFLESARVSFANSPSVQYDVVVLNMSGPEQYEIDDMQKLPRPLDNSVATEETHEKSEQGKRKVQLCLEREKWSCEKWSCERYHRSRQM